MWLTTDKVQLQGTQQSAYLHHSVVTGEQQVC